MKRLLVLWFLLIARASHAQQFVVSGTITDKESGEQLIGVSIYEPHFKTGTACNNYGFYSVKLPADSVLLQFSYLGYKTQFHRLKLNANAKLDIQLEIYNELNEVVVSAEKQNRIENRTQMSAIEIPIKQIKNVPALFGEVDVLKVLQLLPGVKSGGEGSSGLYVRGGGADQNLILLDGVPVYNASHLFGFFSVFNADAIKNVSLVKGGFPARYGGRLSSVIDLSMKEGNMSSFHGEGSLGIISSKIALEGPIIKNRTSFLITGRRTYLDILTRPIIKTLSEGELVFGYYFYDLNGKVNHKINDKNHLYLSLYNGNDKFYFNSQFKSSYDAVDPNGQNVRYNQTSIAKGGLGWGNSIAALRWNYLISEKMFINTNINYTQYRFNVTSAYENKLEYDGKSEENNLSLQYKSGINDWTIKSDIDFFPNNLHQLKLGVRTTFHSFKTGALQFKTKLQGLTLDSVSGAMPIPAQESSAFLEHEWTVSEKLKGNNGLHFSHFYVQNQHYVSLQPRLSARYLLPKNYALKASYAQMVQFIHLLTNSNVGLPTDLWVPATALVKPQQSNQIAAALVKSLYEGVYEISIETYYKTMRNIIEYFDGANFLNTSTDWQKKVESGRGKSYGAEFLFQRKEGAYTGWVGYTLSWTDRTFPTINFGKTFPYKYDKRHDVSFVLSYKINSKLDVSGTWVYSSGTAITLAVAQYNAFGEYHDVTQNGGFNQPIDFYGGRNNFRMPSYHRADIGLNYRIVKKWGESVWNVSIYNLYNRWNPYFIFYANENGRDVAKQVSLFPIIPSVSYGFKF